MYGDDATVDDLRPCDQLTAVCPCGHSVGPAFATWTRAQRLMPLRDLRRAMVCQKCGLRAPRLVITAYGGAAGGMREVKRWPG
jgi:hypothetical protein